jgi:hypothetical protein
MPAEFYNRKAELDEAIRKRAQAELVRLYEPELVQLQTMLVSVLNLAGIWNMRQIQPSIQLVREYVAAIDKRHRADRTLVEEMKGDTHAN